MRTIFIYLLMTTVMFGLVVNEASAKRFGGGRGFGLHRSQSNFFSYKKAPMKSFARPVNARKGSGFLKGLLIGGLLSSLFMGHGFGAGLLSWFVLIALLLFIFNMIRHKMHPSMHRH